MNITKSAICFAPSNFSRNFAANFRNVTKYLISIALALMLYGCGNAPQAEDLYGLPGAWTRVRKTYPSGDEQAYPHNNGNICRIYDRDSSFYECQFLPYKSGIIVIAGATSRFTIKEKAPGEWEYREEGKRRPFRFVGDSVIQVQTNGTKYELRRTPMSETRMEEIRQATRQVQAREVEMRRKYPELENHNICYVISTAERELKTTNYRLLLLVLVLLGVLAAGAVYLRRIRLRKKRIEEQLRQIEEEAALRPQSVAKVLREVENEFFDSEEFLSLKRDIAAGRVLSPKEWKELENRAKVAFPDFIRNLARLCRLSVVEWRVCLLVRLRFTPTEIATALAKETSSISSIRSRLFKKIFDRPGSTKDWDNFIHSL